MQQTGAELRDSGIQRAKESAEAACHGWSEQAYGFVRLFARQGREFRCEQVREYATEHGLPSAPSARAWGGVMRRAVSAGLIERVGFASCSNPAAHCAPVGTWRGVTGVSA